jgi:asparagine synthase (glutamine-hydrolysing)
MCGIAGFLSPDAGADRMASIIRAMTDCLHHRGPDDAGTWVDAEAGIALGHRRLSIIDLSPTGHQPMISADDRFIVTFNGEIYNFREMRAELEARCVQFRGHSDTEVMLEAFATFGVQATITQLIGMFSIAVWDRRERKLTLVRDRLGIKPLYWARFGDLFLFASELKALRMHPGWTPRLNESAVAAYMRLNYIPAPHSVYHGVFKLEPGCLLTFASGQEPQIERFWDARTIARDGLLNRAVSGDGELIDELEALLKDAVRRRMVADVPVGAFLSGGVDSSTVAALMQAADSGPVRTYTIGFELPGFNEAPYSAAVARHLGTQHTELTVTAKEALGVIPRLAEIYDEPFADSSQIPTYLVSAMTRQHVTVALSGDGGDELFAGYYRYRAASREWRGVSLFPLPLRRAAANLLTRISPERWSNLLYFLPARLRPGQLGDKVHKVAAILGLPDGDAVYRRLISHWEPSEIMPGVGEAKGIAWDASLAKDIPSLLERMQFLDLVTYLPDDILTKVDRASMAVSLEARVPLLDHRVVEFALRLPESAKIRGRTSKWLVRQVLYRHVPAAFIERPKMGFGVPLAEWLRGPLRDWAEALLSENRLRDLGTFDVARVRGTWAEHLSGRRNWQYLLWDVLMFQAWNERWG